MDTKINKRPAAIEINTLEDGGTRVEATMYVNFVGETAAGNRKVVLVREGDALKHERFSVILDADASAPKPGTRVVNPTFCCLAKHEGDDIVVIPPTWTEPKRRDDGSVTPPQLHYTVGLIDADKVIAPAAAGASAASAAVFARATAQQK